MARRIRPIDWFRLNIDAGKPWRLKVSHHSFDRRLIGDDGKPLYGITIFDDRSILVNAHYPRTTYPETIVHELVHAAAEKIDLSAWIEEPFVAVIESGLTRLFTQLGYNLPALPDGYSEMCAAARKRGKRK